MIKNKSFTLVEILIVIVIIGFIIGFSIYWYNKIYNTELLLNKTASYLVSILNLAKQKSLITEENKSWGVWLINNQNGPDLIRLIKENTSTIEETFNLPSGINFIEPQENFSKVIIFQKLSGETTSTIIKISYLSKEKIINISTSGRIYLE